MEVKVIQPTSSSSGTAGRERPARLRVAAYCRVSTDNEEQKSSYEAQCRHYTSYINANPSWTLVGIFADEGISGTQAKRRPEFLRMVEACRQGQIDLVITKSISRFARNTMDCLDYIRQLRALDIPVLFEKESINTMDSTGEVLITILASLAQQESASISQNVKMGIRYVMQEGRGRLNYRQFLGYTAGPTKGSLVIVPQEADTVRLIYRRYLEGSSPARIARQLENVCVPTPTGRTRWHASTIASILRNEKYCGDLLLQKYYTQDYLTHRIVRNHGQLPQYFVEDHHDPIVPKAVFAQVQGEIARRSSLRDHPALLRSGSESALRGRLLCGRCGRALKRCVGPSGEHVWRCCSRAVTWRAGEGSSSGDCPMRLVAESDVREALLRAFDRLSCLGEAIRLAREGLWLRISQLDVCLECSDDAESMREVADIRARLAAQEVQLRMIAELVSEMNSGVATAANLCEGIGAAATVADCHEGIGDVASDRDERVDLPATGTSALASPGAQHQPTSSSASACADYEDFFLRTRWEPPQGLLDEHGRMRRFDERTIVRYLQCVVVHEGSYEVVLKAGISLCVR